jgi:hypothetical protein
MIEVLNRCAEPAAQRSRDDHDAGGCDWFGFGWSQHRTRRNGQGLPGCGELGRDSARGSPSRSLYGQWEDGHSAAQWRDHHAAYCDRPHSSPIVSRHLRADRDKDPRRRRRYHHLLSDRLALMLAPGGCSLRLGPEGPDSSRWASRRNMPVRPIKPFPFANHVSLTCTFLARRDTHRSDTVQKAHG